MLRVTPYDMQIIILALQTDIIEWWLMRMTCKPAGALTCREARRVRPLECAAEKIVGRAPVAAAATCVWVPTSHMRDTPSLKPIQVPDWTHSQPTEWASEPMNQSKKASECLDDKCAISFKLRVGAVLALALVEPLQALIVLALQAPVRLLQLEHLSEIRVNCTVQNSTYKYWLFYWIGWLNRVKSIRQIQFAKCVFTKMSLNVISE